MEGGQPQAVEGLQNEAVALEEKAPGLQVVAGAEAQEMEDQNATDGEEEDMRANDPACLLCDDGGANTAA